MLGLDNALRFTRLVFLSLCPILVITNSLQAQSVFPDKALEAAVRREVFEKRYNTEPITADDVKNISQVVGKRAGIKSLEGLQHCKSIMKIDLEGNEIVDLSPLKDLKLLQSIDLSKNKIESLEPLAQLTNSQYLQLSQNSISDLAPLKDMNNLRSLYVSGNKIKSLEPLANLKKMWTLNVAGNPIENASPISSLKGLDSINFQGCSIKSVEFLRNMAPHFLMLRETNIDDFGPLVEACEADAKGDHRFAQFMQLYLDDATLKNEKHAAMLERLRAAKVRINPAPK